MDPEIFPIGVPGVGGGVVILRPFTFLWKFYNKSEFYGGGVHQDSHLTPPPPIDLFMIWYQSCFFHWQYEFLMLFSYMAQLLE